MTAKEIIKNVKKSKLIRFILPSWVEERYQYVKCENETAEAEVIKLVKAMEKLGYTHYECTMCEETERTPKGGYSFVDYGTNKMLMVININGRFADDERE